MKTGNFVIYFLGAMLLVNGLPRLASGGEIYSYVDEDGVLNYTDRQPINRSRFKVEPATEQDIVNQAVRIYQFVDSKGVIHITDQPKDSRYQLIYQGSVSIPLFSTELDIAPSAPIHQKYDHYNPLIQDVATRTQLEPALLHAVIQIESAYNSNAISPKGAVGLMQLMPATAKRFGVTDRTDATTNVYGGALYLRHLLELFDGDMNLALAGYNAGENAVKRYGNEIPPYRETKNYVKKVMRLYDTYRDHM
ncbi:MAG TPA: DUF4124 domain-containing protein [Thioploca sp.]|nr:MAG: murein transglycosylase [Gammaproteobacteria bacterium]HDN27941.1 DUF4124 domain-containing protein [Thioploca sp.]